MTQNGRVRVVITGVGTVNAVGNDVDAFYDALVEGKSGVAKLEGWDAESNPSHVAGQIKNLDIAQHLEPKEIRRTARFTQIAIIAARQALAMAGVDLKPSANGDRPDGLNPGTRRRQQRHIPGELHRHLPADPVRRREARAGLAVLRPAGAPEHGGRGAGDRVRAQGPQRHQRHRLRRQHPVHRQRDARPAVRRRRRHAHRRHRGQPLRLGHRHVQRDEGAHHQQHRPRGASRPFDLNRDGFVGAEGAGYLFLETEEHACAGARRSSPRSSASAPATTPTTR